MYGVLRSGMLPSTYTFDRQTNGGATPQSFATPAPPLKGASSVRSGVNSKVLSRRRPERLRAMSNRGLPVSCM